jgi:hypothetical protein
MREFRVYELRFATKTHLEQAFALVFDSDDIASCQLELPDQRLRFLAAPDTGATLVDLLYQRGGMTWCVSHRLGQEPGP